MVVRILGGAVLWAMLAVGAAEAESLAQLGGPANPPPGSFKGQQFIDSRGCLFLRAGYGTGVNWVARIDRNHRPICGMMPTGSAAAQAAMAADMAPAAKPAPLVQVPVATPAPVQRQPDQGLAWLFGPPRQPVQTAPAPANAAVAAPQTSPPQQPAFRVSGVATSVPGVQCYDNAPVLQRVQVSGGTALVCTRGDGSGNGWRPPMVASTRAAMAAAPGVVATAAPVGRYAMPTVVMAAPAVLYAAPAAAAAPLVRSHALPKPPAGWTYAWKDDRLNPLRGVGTAEGQAQQDRLWTRTVPMVLIADLPAKRFTLPKLALQTQASTMSAAVSAVPSGKLLIQVGSFSQPGNAQGSSARLAAMGLPVSTVNLARKGKALQIVYAGPFATLAEAQAGLAALHAAGFADAFLR